MHDQASELRELVRRGTLPVPSAPSSRVKLLVITGGKGGVGTTTIAVNLAVVLAGQRRRTVLVDADPQGGDAAMLSGVEERYTLADVLTGRRTARNVLQPGPVGLQILPAGWAPGDLREPSRAAYQRLIGQLHNLSGEVDFIVVDAGNGVSRAVQQFWQAADMVLLVTTPEPASLMDTYASIKRLASHKGSLPIHAPIRTLVNKVSSRSAARAVHTRLAQACLRFLGVEVSGIGYVQDDPRAGEAGRARKPVVIRTRRCRSARQIGRLAKTVIQRTKRSALTT